MDDWDIPEWKNNPGWRSWGVHPNEHAGLEKKLKAVEKLCVNYSSECATYRTALALISRKSPNGHLGDIARQAMKEWDKREPPADTKELT